MISSRRHPTAIVLILTGVLLAPGACSSETEEENQTQQPSEDTTPPPDTDTPPDDPPPECETWDDEPTAIFLTWQRDPTSTMTVDWHIDAPENTEDDSEYDPRESLCIRASGDDDWDRKLDAEQHPVPHLDRKLFRTEITDLDPGAEYVFQVGEFEREYRFRTMPHDIDDEPLTFAAGGDVLHIEEMSEKTNRAAMAYDPEFIVWGGDLAYADAGTDPFHKERWEWWFDAIADTLVDDDGRVVPIVLSIGNHEVKEGYYYEHDDYEQTDAWRAENAPYFYGLFAFPGQPGYGVLDFGDYLTLISLDSDHTNPVEGEQTEWLHAVLETRVDRGVDHVMPFYHVAAFPSHRDFDGDIQTRIRDHWVPLFEEHGVRLVFENHDHTYKRTHPIRGGEIDDDGIVYIGDGAWGVLTRSGESKDEWYIDQLTSERHAVIVTLQGDDHHALVVSEDEEILDEYGEPL